MASLPSRVSGQLPIGPHVYDRVAAGGDVEEYLRTLQVAGLAPLQPWSIRPFSPSELNRLVPADTASHPWGSFLKRPKPSRASAYIIAPTVQAIYNTTFPYGYNDGPIWAGRGLTTAVDFGFGGHVGPLSFVIDPEAFRAENKAFPLQSTGLGGNGIYFDPYTPNTIDQPQRFGNKPYQRLDPGQSTMRLDVWKVTAGVGTEDQFWGPAVWNPILLGNNAPGFRHVFAGLRDGNLGIVRLSTNMVWGELDESYLMPDVRGSRRRIMSGIVATATVSGFPGLEVGGGRFFQESWPDSGLRRSDFLRPFNALLKSARARQIDSNTGDESDDQLGSVFARWAVPAASVEVYAEYGREDYNIDVSDLVSEPDHDASYLVGMQRVWRKGGNALLAMRAELLNSRQTLLNGVRAQAPFYVHIPLIQGFTNEGQVLGSYAAHGGGGSDIAIDWYRPDGRWTIDWTRILLSQAESTGYSATSANAVVTNALEVARLIRLKRLDVSVGLTSVSRTGPSRASSTRDMRLTMKVASGI